MSNFKITATLEQQTPMIHFQHSQDGATLRACDVKPKLDKFIIQKNGGYEELKKSHKDWFLEGKTALNYRMSIRAHGEPERSYTTDNAIQRFVYNDQSNNTPRGIPIAKSYFGNMVDLHSCRTNEDKIAAIKKAYKDVVFYINADAIELTIICFKPELLKIIRDNLEAFFLLHNFGTRSNKGFGSFIVSKINGSVIKDLDKRINDIYAHNCNMQVYSYKDNSRVIEANRLLGYVDELYKLMKSGINFRGHYFRSFLFVYMHDKEKNGTQKNIGNEKAYLKKSDDRLIMGTHSDNSEIENRSDCGEENYRYVRAMLGVGDTIRFVDSKNEQNRKPTVTVSFKIDRDGIKKVLAEHRSEEEMKKIEKEIERIKIRYPSPILFKIVKDRIFIIPNPEEEFIFGKKFVFSISGNDQQHILSTPSKDEFDLGNFLAKFVEYINVEIQDKLIKAKNAGAITFSGKLEEVKTVNG